MPPSPAPAPPAKLHFASLEALRFFAFLKVYLFHVPIQVESPLFNYLKRGGGIGVQFFFVLSGFLITYLLVADKRARGQVDARGFLIRRSLRIWPLFYAGVLLAFLVPDDLAQRLGLHMVSGGYVPDWRFSFTFLENYKMLLMDNFPRTTPLPVFWSLCIEEHFYLVWVAAIFLVPRRHILTFLLACLPLAYAFRALEPFVFPNNVQMETNDLLTHLDEFAIGGLLGYWVAVDYAGFSARLNGIRLPVRYLLLAGALLVIVCQADTLPYAAGSLFNIFRSTAVALLFALIIAVFLPAGSAIRLENPVLAYLGRISYGLYVFHILFIHMAFQYCLDRHIVVDSLGKAVLMVAVTLGPTVALSSLSFRYFETPFLRLRERLTRPVALKAAV
ncbi:acyltransferase family protein [Hymenobacter ruricola]|uniref:Acyltransferase n=1 Tax=Hymenobacter ruricola TaxID=2791023 RepID=A0ABS0IAX4_9BACT|nr:acyltransferase [Hymenobacter ruricola]MBF9224100.1 acyltransferase [Hymenobacter ruricola]